MKTKKSAAQLVPKARRLAETFFKNPADLDAARRLVILADKLTAQNVVAGHFIDARASEARRVLSGRA